MLKQKLTQREFSKKKKKKKKKPPQNKKNRRTPTQKSNPYKAAYATLLKSHLHIGAPP